MRTISPARRFPLRLAALAALAAALGCGAPAPDELHARAEAAYERGDSVEVELLLQRVLATEELDEGLAIRAHMLRALNFVQNLQDVEQCRAELETVLALATIHTDEGVTAATALANTHLPEGIEAFNTELDRHLATLPPLSERALTMRLHRWQTLARNGASDEIAQRYPGLLAHAVSCEDLVPAARRDLSLNLTLLRIDLARALEDWAGAVEICEHFISLFPDSDASRFMPFEITTMLREMGRDEEAAQRAAAGLAVLEARLTTLTSSNEQAATAISIADAHQVLGDLDAARAAYSQAFDTYPDFTLRPRAMLGWAMTLTQEGSEEEAIRVATRVALEYPNVQENFIAERMIAEINARAAARASAEATAGVASSPEI